MLLTISTTHQPATELGFLLHKHPDKWQTFELSFGQAHVFYPEADETRCTAALLMEVDPVGLVRGKDRHGQLQQYVNDRPYVASSYLSVAIGKVFGSALSGTCHHRPQLANTRLPLEIQLTALPCRGGESLLRRLFEPLGYTVTAQADVLDEQFPEWGMSPYYTVTLTGELCLSDALSHLYVLIPVLDKEKHYWVDEAEVDKLLRHGEGWLSDHPELQLITRRYLKFKHSLTRQALERLLASEAETEQQPAAEEVLERPINLNQQRIQTVVEVLKGYGVQRVADLGCGEGKLLRELLSNRTFTQIIGLDVASRALEIAQRRLKLERLSPRQRERIRLLQGSLLYRDPRLKGLDAATVIEVIEHLEPDRLEAFERVLFEHARPGLVVITTPNAEYNVKFEGLTAGRLRHPDHRFEWSRKEFRGWADEIAGRYGYSVEYVPVGEEDEVLGPPTQMAVFVMLRKDSI